MMGGEARAAAAVAQKGEAPAHAGCAVDKKRRIGPGKNLFLKKLNQVG